MTQPKTNRIPAPLYAAAGAGELAYQQLRKLPLVVTELGGKAVIGGFELREKAVETLRTANDTADRLREKTVPTEALDLDRLREVATRNAAAVLASAQAAQERALAAYGALVARGERVVGSGVVQAADTVNSDIEATDATVSTGASSTATAPTEPVQEVAPEVTATPATVAEVVENKPAEVKAARARTTKASTAPTTPSAKLPKSAAKRTRPTAS